VDYEFTFYGSAVIEGVPCNLGCTFSGTNVLVGPGPEVELGPFTPDFADPSTATAQMTVDWDATSIAFNANLLSGFNGQISGMSLSFSNLDPPMIAPPVINSPFPSLGPTITSFTPSSFSIDNGSFTFFMPRSIIFELTTVPEPSSLFLFIASVGAFATVGRRRQSRNTNFATANRYPELTFPADVVRPAARDFRRAD
jgi:hypothetical protein